jgi:predicted Zn-dependent peptidase
MPVTIKKYPNDFKIVYEKSHSTIPITALYVFCDVGPVYEYDKMRGASHFIEHMCFKGTKKIPHSKDIFNEYAKIGAYFNAYTSKRYTCYTVKCQDEYIHHSLDILADMLMNSLFNETEFDKEEKVVMEENNNDDNKPEHIINDTTDQLIYAGSSYEFPIDSIDYHTKRSLQYKNVVEFYRKYYHPSNMFISVVSNCPFHTIESYVKKTPFIKKEKEITTSSHIINHNLTPQSSINIRLINKRGITNVHLNIGFRTNGHDNKDKFCLTLLEKIMGDGLNGRLMMILRERRGLVYGASANSEQYEHSGLFCFSTKTKVQNFKKVLPLMVSIITDMIKKGITKDELKVAKGNFKGTSLLDLQDIVTQAIYNGEEILMGEKKVIPYKDLYEKCILPITIDDMNRVIKQYFTIQNMCVCVLSEKLPSLESIRKVCNEII